MVSTLNERDIVMAMEAMAKDKNLSLRKAAKIYNITHTTLIRRMKGITPASEYRQKQHKITKIEEEVIIQHIIDMDERGFSPKFISVESMANHILESRGGKRVGKQWVYRFVNRHNILKTRFNRAYDFQRALCEDPKLINKWFQLFKNIKAKYGIQECDIWNFDETGFMMGVISSSMVITSADRCGKSKGIQPGNREWSTAIVCGNATGENIPPYLLVQGQMHLANWYSETDMPPEWVVKTTINGWTNNETGLEWLKHFDKHTKLRTKGAYRMLVLDGYESHESGPFQNYCIEHKIKAVGLPPHSSHLIQPFDVSCFSVLKRAYSKQIEGYMRMHINHISKVEFFIAFNAAYEQAITMENMKAGFRGAGLVPFNPDAVLSRMDIRIRTPTPPSLPSSHMPDWVSQTPHNATEALSQAFLVRSIIARHHSSSPTPIFKATDPLIKGVEYLASTVTILAFENHDLRLANTGLSKRRRAKKTQLRLGGALTIQEANDIISQKEVDVQIKCDRQQNGRNSNREASTNRCCSKCGIIGHNARTCSNDNIDPKLLDSA